MYKVPDRIARYSMAIYPVIFEDLHIAHTWKKLAWPHYFTMKEIWARKTSLRRTLFIEVHVPSHAVGVGRL